MSEAMAILSEDIWTSKGSMASHPYGSENGVALVGVRTVVRYAQRHSPNFSSQSCWLSERNFFRSLAIVMTRDPQTQRAGVRGSSTCGNQPNRWHDIIKDLRTIKHSTD